MPASLNRWTGIGNLGRDPELKYTPAGSAVCEFNMAVNETWRDQDGSEKSKVEWIRVVCWGKTAENVGEYLAKGSSVYVEGRLQTDEWEKDGVKRWTTKVISNRIQFLGGKGSGQGGAASAAPATSADDLPFE